jgi:predicted glycosyltransferase
VSSKQSLCFYCSRLTAYCLLTMRLWIDLANSPHVPFFRALIPEFEKRGAEVETTARDFAQTIEMAEAAGLAPVLIGAHGGRALTGKAGNLINRARALRKWARGRKFDLAVSHNSYAQVAAARSLSIKSVTLMDYEHQPANHLAFRLAQRIIVPRSFPEAALQWYGAQARKVRRYHGTKEDVYLADFAPDPRFAETLFELGVKPEDVVVVVRPPAHEALYHRFENELFDELLRRLSAREDVKIILLARNQAQRASYSEPARKNLILPRKALDGANLIAAADLVISAGGTMNREAAALGVPAATVYAGRWAAIDEALVREGRLRRILTREDLDALPVEKKRGAQARRALHVRAEVVDLILGE